MVHVDEMNICDRPVSAYKNSDKSGRILIWWLGQAGFLIKCGEYNILIDPYLSDALAKKYQGTAFPHIRLMSPPIATEALTSIHAILCTHAHSDHMDPEIFPLLLENNPDIKIVIPASAFETAISRGATKENIILLNHGDHLNLLPGISLEAVASAHESIETNQSGEHLYLGYMLNYHGYVIYHSGDNCPYDGLLNNLRQKQIDIAMLPVNGRGKGVKGNFTFNEAVDIVRKSNIPILIVHHFGMFDFNTVPLEALKKYQNQYSDEKCHIFVPEVNKTFEINR